MKELLHIGEMVEFRYAKTTLRGQVEQIGTHEIIVAIRDYRAFKRSIRNRWHPPDRTRVGWADILRIEKRA